jgi:predicted  nucleic acid-binding Zn-ribbon protein
MKKAIEDHTVAQRRVEAKEIDLEQLRAEIECLQKHIDEVSKQSA